MREQTMNEPTGTGSTGGTSGPGNALPGALPGGGPHAEPVPAWLDSRLSDFGAPQAVIDGLILRLGFQAMARLIADRPTLRLALIAEYRRQCEEMRPRLIHEEWNI